MHGKDKDPLYYKYRSQLLLITSADDRKTLVFEEIVVMMRVRGSGIRMDN